MFYYFYVLFVFLIIKLPATYCIDICTILKCRINGNISLQMLQEYAARLGKQRFYLEF